MAAPPTIESLTARLAGARAKVVSDVTDIARVQSTIRQLEDTYMFLKTTAERLDHNGGIMQQQQAVSLNSVVDKMDALDNNVTGWQDGDGVQFVNASSAQVLAILKNLNTELEAIENRITGGS